MELKQYLGKMISQEACALSNCALSNDESNSNHETIMAIYNRLERFVKDYDEYSRTGDII